MKKYAECCAEVGYDPKDYSPPEQKYTFFGYKNGNAVRFETHEMAKAFSPNIEKVKDEESERAVAKYHENIARRAAKAEEVWMNSLKEEYDFVSPSVFSLCYSKAWDDGHSSAHRFQHDSVYDSVYYKMEEYVEFAISILKTVKQ